MNQAYELMLVIRAEVEVTDKTATELVDKLLSGEAKMTSVSVLGKKRLAYEIQKQTEGVYVLAKLEGTIHVHEIEKKVQVGSQVLRYLLTTVN